MTDTRTSLRARLSSRRPGIGARAAAVALMAVVLAAATGAGLLSHTDSAQAMTVAPLSLSELGELAEDVVVAQVRSAGVRRSGAGAIETTGEIHTQRVLKGRGGGPSLARTPGGRLGGEEMVVPGSPELEPGHTYLLFLDEQGRVIAGPLGRLTVVGDRVPALGARVDEVAAVVRGEGNGRRGLGASVPALGGVEDPAAVTGRSEQVTPDPTATAAGPSAQAAPGITGISPARGSAGTGTLVTLSGSGFGSTQGTVTFPYRDPQRIEAPVRSWSDTRIVVEVPVAYIDYYAAAAGSGDVLVTTAQGAVSNGMAFDVTFAYGGMRWDQDRVDFYVNPNTLDTTEETRMLIDAAATWSSAADFELRYAGTDSSVGPAKDGRNVISWSSTAVPVGTLAQAAYWYRNGVMTEADICFNDNFDWRTGSIHGEYDVQTTGLHEMGHWLSLRDLYGDDSEKVMWGFALSGGQKRTLAEGDRDGVGWIYGAPGTPSTTTTLAPTTTTTTAAPPSTTTTTAPPASRDFADVPPTHEFYPAVTSLAGAGIIGGYADGTFGLYDPVLRAQLAKMAVLAYELHDPTARVFSGQTFADVENDGREYPFVFVEEAAGAGLVNGYADGLFGPFRPLTRVQLVRILVRAAGGTLAQPPAGYDPGFGDVPPGDRDVVGIARYNELINGTGPTTFNPYGTATRGHVAKILHRALGSK